MAWDSLFAGLAVENPAAQRMAALDTLRGVAVLLVLARHMAVPAALPAWLDVPLHALQRGGWVGVDLFFVLSGFLVSGLLFREWTRHGELRAGRFLIRRGFKIYPAFYVMFAVVLLWSARGGRWPGIGFVASEALFVQNYGPALFPHTWSLAVEEHFYLALPLLLWLVRGKKDRPFAALPRVFAIIAIACLALRIVGAWGQTHATRASFAPTHLRCDSLLMGVLISWLVHFHGEKIARFVQRWRWWMLAAAVPLAAPAFVFDLATTSFLFTFGFTALYVAAGLILLFAVHHPGRRGALAWVGFYSYSIYLWHIPVERIFLPMLLPAGFPPLLGAVAYFAASIAAGVLAAWIVELPFLRLRDRFFPSRLQPSPARERAPLDASAHSHTTHGHVA